MKASRPRIIGVDESGKGDFFGPLVIAGVLVTAEDHEALKALGVRDGKTIADKKLMGIDEQLRSSYPHSLISYSPKDYNAKWQAIRNLNLLLAEGHVGEVGESHPCGLDPPAVAGFGVVPGLCRVEVAEIAGETL